jgi:PAS domain S-box-containing protein
MAREELSPDGSEYRFRQLLDMAPDAMVVVAEDETITFVNLQSEKLFGYPRAELLGQRLELLIPERFRGGHHGHVSRFFANPVTRPMGSGLQLFGRRKDGSELPIEVSLSPLRTETGMYVSAAIRDVTERRRIEQVAKLNADRLASAVESIQDAFALFDAEERLVLCNSVYRKLLANCVADGPLVGRTYRELLDAWIDDLSLEGDDAREAFRSMRLAARKDPNSAFDVRTRDGRSLRVSERRTAEGGMVSTTWDLTADVGLAEELRDARSVAEAASAAKTDFLSSMSHELRTPLNAILGFAQLLRRDKKEPLSLRHLERVDQILKGGEHLLRLIDDILDLSRIEAGAVSISVEPVSVFEVLNEVTTTLGTAAARVEVTMHVDPVPEGLPMVAADRTRFAQILMNFGSNAIKYNRRGGTVTFTVSTSGPNVRIVILDTGLGIPLDKQGKLFQPFQRAGQETGTIEGTGIGLLITKRLAELMNGHVGFESTPAQGSKFWVEIPVYAGTPHESRASTPEAGATAERSDVATHSILYVEDNPANIAFMRDLIDGIEHVEFLTAPTAEMGIEMARTHRPDIVLMDINLPGMSGLDALQVLRNTPETREMPVIALTAAASERDKARGMQLGFYRYLTKPVKVDELMSALETLLAR